MDIRKEGNWEGNKLRKKGMVEGRKDIRKEIKNK